MDLVMTLVVINFGPCVEYQDVCNVVEIMLTDFIMFAYTYRKLW
jgi:hypothetical protein